MASSQQEQPTFPLSPAPQLPEGQYVRTCGMIVIGDEVLNGERSSIPSSDDGITAPLAGVILTATLSSR